MAWLEDGGNSHHLTDSPVCSIAHLHNHFKTTFRIKKPLNIFFLKGCCILLDWGAFDWSLCPMECTATGRDWRPWVCVECLPHVLPVPSLLICLSQSHHGCRHQATLGGLGMVLLPPFPSLGGGEKNLYSFSFITHPESTPPLTQNLTMKGHEGASLTCQVIWRNGRRSWGLGVRLPQLSQCGGFVTTNVSHLKPEKPKNARLLSFHFYCYEGDAGVVLARRNNHRAFACA